MAYERSICQIRSTDWYFKLQLGRQILNHIGILSLCKLYHERWQSDCKQSVKNLYAADNSWWKADYFNPKFRQKLETKNISYRNLQNGGGKGIGKCNVFEHVYRYFSHTVWPNMLTMPVLRGLAKWYDAVLRHSYFQESKWKHREEGRRRYSQQPRVGIS